MMNRKASVYVPSTVDGKTPNPVAYQNMLQHVLRAMAVMFGGATATTGQGAYMSEEPGIGLIVEPVSIVSSYCDDATMAKHRDEVVALAKHVCTVMRQECVSVVFGDTMEFVSLAKEAA